MKKKIMLSLVFFSLFLFMFYSKAALGFGSIFYRISDQNNNKLPGVSIYLDGKVIGTSNDTGEYIKEGVTAGYHFGTLQKQNFQTYYYNINVVENIRSMLIAKLQPLPPEITYTCTDTDSSTYPTRNYNIKGTGTLKADNSVMPPKSMTDSCVDQMILNETVCYYQTDTNGYEIFKSELSKCSYGCYDGACMNKKSGKQIIEASPLNSNWLVWIVGIIIVAFLIYWFARKGKKK